MLIRSNLTLSNLIFCIRCKWTGKVVLEQTEKLAITRGLWIHPSIFVLAKYTRDDESNPTIGVVHGSGQILDRICEDIVQFSQRLLDALGNQR
jgi:hypothetical protein